jgi:rhodanese-related sulfurtransferase
MKKLLFILLLIVVTAIPAFAGHAKDISSAEAQNIIAKNKNIFILDVRTPMERSQGFITGSVLIPIDTIEKRLAEIPRNRPVIVYCAVGSRSRAVAQALAGQGYAEIYNMRDGIFGWSRSGFPVQR